jgi:hypothetical protein
MPGGQAQSWQPVWEAYSTAYEIRYGHKPARSARENSLCAQLVQRIGIEEAVQVAKFYLDHSDRWYVQKIHPLNLLIADCQKLRTEWLAGEKMTRHKAERCEVTANNDEVFRKFMEKEGML